LRELSSIADGSRTSTTSVTRLRLPPPILPATILAAAAIVFIEFEANHFASVATLSPFDIPAAFRAGEWHARLALMFVHPASPLEKCAH
jgi:hypothetical protein